MAEITGTRTDEKGREVVIYSNGLEKDKLTGHIVTPPENHITTSEQGRELVMKRWKANEEAFRRGIHKGLMLGELPSPDELTVKECEEIGRILGETIADPKFRNRLAENIRVAMEVGALTPNKTHIELDIKTSDPYSQEEKLMEAAEKLLQAMQENNPP